MCSPKMLSCLCSLSLFFSRQLTFTLLAASISHSLTAVMKFFFFQRNSSHLFLITRSSSFHVIQVSVDKKKPSKKEARLCYCFFSLKVREAMLSPAKTPLVACGVIPVNWVILHWYACGTEHWYACCLGTLLAFLWLLLKRRQSNWNKGQ